MRATETPSFNGWSKHLAAQRAWRWRKGAMASSEGSGGYLACLGKVRRLAEAEGKQAEWHAFTDAYCRNLLERQRAQADAREAAQHRALEARLAARRAQALEP